jgi:hypothetical protein
MIGGQRFEQRAAHFPTRGNFPLERHSIGRFRTLAGFAGIMNCRFSEED